MESPVREKTTEKPRLVVLPLQPHPGPVGGGIGLGVHFLLGNIVATHTGLKEFWFGWRIKKLFAEKEELSAYCRGEAPALDIARLGKEQKIRYWLRGRVQTRANRIQTSLVLTDAENGCREWAATLALDPADRCIGFHQQFSAWLDACGLAFPQGQTAKTRWPEKTTLDSLDLLGRDLETYYRHAAYSDTTPGAMRPLSPDLFDPAVRAAPTSFLAHDLRGWILYKTGQYHAAEESFQKAIGLNPNGIGALSGLMWCAVYMGNQEKACRWAVAKADIRGESHEAARAGVEKRMKKALLHAD